MVIQINGGEAIDCDCPFQVGKGTVHRKNCHNYIKTLKEKIEDLLKRNLVIPVSTKKQNVYLDELADQILEMVDKKLENGAINLGERLNQKGFSLKQTINIGEVVVDWINYNFGRKNEKNKNNT